MSGRHAPRICSGPAAPTYGLRPPPARSAAAARHQWIRRAKHAGPVWEPRRAERSGSCSRRRWPRIGRHRGVGGRLVGWGESRRARAMDWRAGSEAGFRLLAWPRTNGLTVSLPEAVGRWPPILLRINARECVSGRQGTSMTPRMSTADSPWRAAGERFVDAKN